MSIDIILGPEEARIIGCLMEKEVITPDQCPLTLNALRNACNQKSSREPVMSLEPGLVARTARQLEERKLVRSSEGKGSVVKYNQRLCNSLLSEFKFTAAEYAIVTLLLLRGPQTPGELKSHSGRLYAFDEYDEVKTVLDGLVNREDGPVSARLPRKPGRKDHEYMHLFSGDVESVSEEASVSERATVNMQNRGNIGELEARVSRLERALLELANRLGEEINLPLPDASEQQQ